MRAFSSHILKYLSVLCAVPLLTLTQVSCTGEAGGNEKPAVKKQDANSAIIKKPASTYNDTLVVEGKSAVFYNPDSLQLLKIIAVNQKETYAMLAHDCHYQMQNARIALQQHWPQIKIFETSRARWLVFVKADKSRVTIDLNEKNDICGLFLFDTVKNPVLADMPNIETVLGFYFQK